MVRRMAPSVESPTAAARNEAPHHPLETDTMRTPFIASLLALAAALSVTAQAQETKVAIGISGWTGCCQNWSTEAAGSGCQWAGGG